MFDRETYTHFHFITSCEDEDPNFESMISRENNDSDASDRHCDLVRVRDEEPISMVGVKGYGL